MAILTVIPMPEPSRGHLYHTELVCPFCPYEVSVSNPIRSAFLRATPDECPNCGADLEEPGSVVADGSGGDE